jgi:hypothetical protein
MERNEEKSERRKTTQTQREKDRERQRKDHQAAVPEGFLYGGSIPLSFCSLEI